MSDPYTTITSQDRETLDDLAGNLELRGKEEQQVRLREEILQNVRGRVMEVGCGTGPVTRHLSKLPGVETVLGIDPSPHFLDLARGMGGDNIEYRVCGGTEIPAGDGSFDCVVLWTTLSHIPRADHGAVFAEIARCLAEGGRLVVFDNDLAGCSMASGQFDLFKIVLDHFPHAWGADNYLMRNLPPALLQAGFARTDPLHLHTVVGTDQRSYGFKVGMRAVEIYGNSGIVSPALTQALRDELNLRADKGTFHIVLSYGSVTAFK
eukprot:GFUD01011514.1.p1 GENE.GFUD01011514.1~~GFUD01011514.1.p1  ORF type:complete len:264 (+),score=89.19 GFUD01011514.1:272-1063(+)